ncbi:MAG: FecR domain-containing protein [Crocinitomicaceae bacterium]
MVKEQDFEALIVRFLEGLATPEEAMLLEDWKRESRENQKMYDHYERLFAQDNLPKVDVDAAWERVHADIKTKVVPMKNWRYWTIAAAAVLVLALLIPGLWTAKPEIDVPLKMGKLPVEEPNNMLFAKTGVQSFTLADSSVVSLKKGSSLELSDKFEKGERRSTLKGSGRFTVVHDEAHPFIIDVEGLEVHDIGTIFDITTNKDTVKVVVLEGSVELRKNDQLLAMEEGDSAFYLISQRLIQEYPTNEALEGISKKFVNTRLEDVASHLSEFFDREIIIKESELKETRFTGTFTDAELPDVLMILKAVLDIKVISTNNKIEIYAAD